MAQFLNVNNDDLVKLTNKLERMHKSDMPLAVRGTLNDAAFDSRKRALKRAKSQFTTRKKTFIPSHTKVNKTDNTFDIKKMQSEMGAFNKSNDNSGDDLKLQEFGGIAKNRDFIPMDAARTGGNKNKLVSKKFYLQKIKSNGKNMFKNQNLIKAVFKTGVGGSIIYDNILYNIRKIVKKSRDVLFIKLIPLYSFEESRSVHLRKKPFIAPAGRLTSKKYLRYFKKMLKNDLKNIVKDENI